jgi:TPR repeat protein
LNDGGGCFNLGLIYEEGKGVKQDDFKALKFIHKSKIRATTAII